MAINLFQNPTNKYINSPKVEGSYRAPFQSTKMYTTTYEPDILYSTNLIQQQEYKQMTLLQIRLEDYYLIRSQQITDAHKQQIERAARRNNFNTKLITQNIENLRPPNIGGKTSDLFRQPAGNLFNRSPNRQNTSNTNNLFQQPQTSPIFQQPNQTINLFQQSTNNQQPANNLFQQSIFQQPKNQQSTLFQQSTTNNLFQIQQPINFTQSMYQQPIGQLSNVQQPLVQMYMPPIMQPQPMNDILFPLKYFITTMENCSRAIDNQLEEQSSFAQQMEEILKEQEREFKSQKIEKVAKPMSKEQEKKRNDKLFYQQSSCSTSASSMRQKSLQTTDSPEKKEISNFNQPNQSQKSSCLKDRPKFDPRYSRPPTYEQAFNLKIHILFLESDRELILQEELIGKKLIRDVKLIVENHLDHIDIFGVQNKEYYQKCDIVDKDNKKLDLQQQVKELKVIKFRYSVRQAPKLTKYGYQCKMNQITDFSKVKDFTIENEYGSLKWPNYSNILHMDLDNVIEIGQYYVKVYDKDILHNLFIPNIGYKLNKECEMTFKLKDTQQISSQFEQNLKQQAEKQDLEFIKIDQDKRTYTVKGQHFSSYIF